MSEILSDSTSNRGGGASNPGKEHAHSYDGDPIDYPAFNPEATRATHAHSHENSRSDAADFVIPELDYSALLARFREKESRRRHRRDNREHKTSDTPFHTRSNVSRIFDTHPQAQTTRQILDQENMSTSEFDASFPGFIQVFDFIDEGEVLPDIKTVEEYYSSDNPTDRLTILAKASTTDQLAILSDSRATHAQTDYFRKSLQFQADILSGRATTKVEHDRYREEFDSNGYFIGDRLVAEAGSTVPIRDIEEVKPDRMRAGITRAALRAAMIGTPEYGAYRMAQQIRKTQNEGKEPSDEDYIWLHPDFPVISGVHSGIDSEDWHYGGAERNPIGGWKPIIDEYAKIRDRVARRNPDATPEEIEHKAVRRAAHIYVEAGNYGDEWRGLESPYVSRFHEAVAWAQLGDGVKSQLDGMRSKIMGVDLHNIGRFIGKSGTSKKLRSYRGELRGIEWSLESLSTNPNETVSSLNSQELQKQERYRAREEVRIGCKYDKLIERTRSEERRAEYERRRQAELFALQTDCAEKRAYFEQRTPEQAISDLETRKSVVERRIEKRKSLAEKAIDLHFVEKRALGEEDRDHPIVDWINLASFGDINWAHRIISRGASYDETINDLSARIIQRIIPTADDDMVASVCSTLDTYQIRSLQKMDRDGVRCSNADDFGTELLIRKTWGTDEIVEKHGKEWLRQAGLGEFKGSSLDIRRADTLMDDWLSRSGQKTGNTGKIDILKKFQAFCESEPWLAFSSSASELLSFPINAREPMKYRWCMKNSAANLEGGWSPNSIGKIIYTRLRTDIDYSLHSASHWLENFQIPEMGYDIKRLKQAREEGGSIDNIEDFRIDMYDHAAEAAFLRDLASLPNDLRKKTRLPSKRQRVEQLFHNPENRRRYEQILDAYRTNQAIPPELLKEISGGSSVYDSDEDRLRGISLATQRLSELGLNRKAYIDDATYWLMRHTTSPSSSLVSAWQNRVESLAQGCPDSADKINAFQTKLKLRDNISKYRDKFAYYGISLEQALDEDATIYELAHCYYGPEEVIRGTSYTIEGRKHLGKKFLPDDERKLSYENQEYVGTVLAADDPRGMTIGHDTGCCMTMGGASDSCIRDGYLSDNAGFFALYEGNGQIVAQSYFYVNPEHPDTVVMDNIESNAGRGAEKIVALYREYFRNYLLDQARKDPSFPIRQVNIGTQYGELVQPLVKMLPQTDIIRNPHGNVYSDARYDQRLLLRLTDEELAAAGINPNHHTPKTPSEKFVPTHEITTNFAQLGPNQSEILVSLADKIFGKKNHEFHDDDYLYDELDEDSMPSSFLIYEQQDATRTPVGFCLAYDSDSETAPGEDALWVSSFGILPSVERSTLENALTEMMNYAESVNDTRIEIDVEAADISFDEDQLSSSELRQFFADHGWSLSFVDAFDEDGDETRYAVLSKTQ